MSISAITTGNTYQLSSIHSRYKQQVRDFKDLASALQSGDLQGAQKAFTTLQKDMQKTQVAADSSSPLSSDFKDLASALKSGDMTAAQKAFAKLQQDIQSALQAQQKNHQRKAAVDSQASESDSDNSSSTDNEDTINDSQSSFEITA